MEAFLRRNPRELERFGAWLYSTVVACHDVSGLPSVEATGLPAPPAPVEQCNMARALLVAIPLSAVLWAGIIFLLL
jgi:hypothetical protein